MCCVSSFWHYELGYDLFEVSVCDQLAHGFGPLMPQHEGRPWCSKICFPHGLEERRKRGLRAECSVTFKVIQVSS